MRLFSISAIAALLIANTAIAADVGPLSAGKPAGVKKAQEDDINPLIFVGVVAVAVGIALAVADNDDGPTNVVPSTTSATTT